MLYYIKSNILQKKGREEKEKEKGSSYRIKLPTLPTCNLKDSVLLSIKTLLLNS